MIRYTTAKKVSALSGEKKTLYVPKIVREETLKMDKIADRIAEATTLTKADVMLILGQIGQQLEFVLEDGMGVKFDGLGIFSPKIKAKSVKEADDCDLRTVQKITVSFRQSDDFKDAVSKSQLVKTDLDKVKHV